MTRIENRDLHSDPLVIKNRELALQKVLIVWITTGLAFLLLPGTFLGVWNLIRITGGRTASQVDPSWIQAHGHAQIFGWVGTFIIGIGFYSLSKMGKIPEFAIARAWWSWAFWTTGITLRWATNLWQWHWRVLLPVSAACELVGFLLFFGTVRRHRSTENRPSEPPASRPAWMLLVLAGSVGFFASLAANLVVSLQSAWSGIGPAVSHGENQRLLVLFTWAFPVLSIWGFSARWLRVFLGLADPDDRLLLAALGANVAGVVAALAGWWIPSMAALFLSAAFSVAALRVLQPAIKPPKTINIHSSFPAFVRIAYGWLLVSALIAMGAVLFDRSGGLWGASRHALTVGFISTMIFSIGQRILPAFCGMRVLYSPTLMFAALALLNLGCVLRVSSEIGAYESYLPALWPLLPVSAVIELTAVTLFAVNLLLTFRQPPAHLASAN